MREIKFRGKEIESGMWLFGFYQCYDGRPYIKSMNKDSRFGCGYEVRTDTIGQFTGLTDKNGIEIYEGDVVRYNNASSDDYPRTGCIAAITFEEAGFLPISEWYCQDVEIIGNVHDNPELVKGDNQ